MEISYLDEYIGSRRVLSSVRLDNEMRGACEGPHNM
jgi:hypothetical protein